MNRRIAVIWCGIIIYLCLIVTRAFAGAETNEPYARLSVAIASNDLRAVLTTVPDIEKLWPQEPENYLKSAIETARFLGRRAERPDAKQALLNGFDHMIQKSCPTNSEQARAWVGLKSDAILYYLNFEEIKNANSKWIEIAGFIGEIRSQIITNYVNQGFLNPPIAPNSSSEVVKRTIEENERHKNMDRLQQILRSKNEILTFHLLHNCSRLSTNDQQNADFIRKIKAAGHLTAEEQRKLQ